MKRRTLLMSSSIIPAAFAADALATPSAQDSQLSKMDPDFSAIEDYFLKKEMPKAGEMSVKNRTMITLAALTTISGVTRLHQATADALKAHTLAHACGLLFFYLCHFSCHVKHSFSLSQDWFKHLFSVPGRLMGGNDDFITATQRRNRCIDYSKP